MCIPPPERPSSDSESRDQDLRPRFHLVDCNDVIKYRQLVLEATDHVAANVFVPMENWLELRRLKMRRRTELRDRGAATGEIHDVDRVVSLEYFQQHAPRQLKQLHDRVTLFEKQFDERGVALLKEKFEKEKEKHQYDRWKRLVMEADDVEGNVALNGHQWHDYERRKEQFKEELCKRLANGEISEEDLQAELMLREKRLLRDVAFEQVEAMQKEVRYYESQLGEERVQAFEERLEREKADPNHDYPTGGYYNDAFMWGCM